MLKRLRVVRRGPQHSMTSMKMRSFSTFMDLQPGCKVGKLRAREHTRAHDLTSCGALEYFSDESAAFVALRQGREPGHAVSLALIAEHPNKQVSCMCLKPRLNTQGQSILVSYGLLSSAFG